MCEGNNLLHHLMGAEIKVARPEITQKVIEETMEELKAAGMDPTSYAPPAMYLTSSGRPPIYWRRPSTSRQTTSSFLTSTPAEATAFVSNHKMKAIKVTAETEGRMLDPVYTASSMAYLIDLCRKKYFKPEDVVGYLQTEGLASLFPYKTPLKAYLKGRRGPWVIPLWSPYSG